MKHCNKKGTCNADVTTSSNKESKFKKCHSSRCKRGKCRKSTKSAQYKSEKAENIEFMMVLFPGLEKKIAKAALRMTNDTLEEAVFLLKVAQWYEREVEENELDMPQMSSFLANVYCDFFRNNFAERESATPDDAPETSEANGSPDQCISSTTQTSKVGVIITKKNGDYKATALGAKI